MSLLQPCNKNNTLYVINKMANIHKKTFPVKLKKRLYRSGASQLLLLVNSVIDV